MSSKISFFLACFTPSGWSHLEHSGCVSLWFVFGAVLWGLWAMVQGDGHVLPVCREVTGRPVAFTLVWLFSICTNTSDIICRPDEGKLPPAGLLEVEGLRSQPRKPVGCSCMHGTWPWVGIGFLPLFLCCLCPPQLPPAALYSLRSLLYTMLLPCSNGSGTWWGISSASLVHLGSVLSVCGFQ